MALLSRASFQLPALRQRNNALLEAAPNTFSRGARLDLRGLWQMLTSRMRSALDTAYQEISYQGHNNVGKTVGSSLSRLRAPSQGLMF
jgi:hypothetical protein